jgi:hypothetical protein
VQGVVPNATERSSARSKLKSLALALVATCLVTCAYLVARHQTFEALQRALGFGATPLHDFEAFFYPMGRKVFTDPKPVEGFLYTPFAALLFAPLAALPYSVAAGLWAAFVVGCTLIIAGLAWLQFANAKGLPRALAPLLVIGSYPALHNLKFGQVSTCLVAFALLAVCAYQHGRIRVAALLLAAVFAVKLYLGVLALLFVFRRDRRALAYFVFGSLVMLALLPAVLLGAQDALDFYRDVANQLHERFGAGIKDANSQGVAAVLRRLGLRALALPVQLVAIGVLALWARRLARGSRSEIIASVIVLLGMTPFVAPTSWPHYFVYLPFGQAFVQSLLRGGGGARFWFAQASNWLSMLLVAMPFFDFVADRVQFVAAGFPFFANLLLLVGLHGALRVEVFAKQAPTSLAVARLEGVGFMLVCIIATLGRFTLEPYDDAYFFKRFAVNFIDHGAFAWNLADGPVHGNTSQAFQLLATAVTALARDHSVALTRVLMMIGVAASGLLCARASKARFGRAGAFLAFTSPVALATIFSGMETPLALLVAALFIACGASALPPRGRALALGSVLGLSYLVRPDLPLLLGPALATELWRERGLSLRHVCAAGAVGAFLIATTLLVCAAYYGSPVPLAFYLKTGQSKLYDAHFLALSALSKREHLLLLAVTFSPLLMLARRAWDRELLLSLLPPLVFIAYHATFTVEVMGMHGRFYAPALPWLAVAAARGLDARAEEPRKSDSSVDLTVMLGMAAVAIVLYALKLIPTTRGWPVGRVEPAIYLSYLLAATLLVMPALGTMSRRAGWAFATLALGLAVAHPVTGFSFPSDTRYLERHISHVTSYRGMQTLLRCFGRTIDAYHSEIGVIGLELQEGTVTDLGGIMEPDLARGRTSFDAMCRADQPEAIFLPHKNYRALNREIAESACMMGYSRVVAQSSSPLFVRNDLLARYRACEQQAQ